MPGTITQKQLNSTTGMILEGERKLDNPDQNRINVDGTVRDSKSSSGLNSEALVLRGGNAICCMLKSLKLSFDSPIETNEEAVKIKTINYTIRYFHYK